MLWIVVVVAALAGLLIFLSRQTLSNADAWASVISCLVVVAGIVSPRLVHWFRHLGNRLPLETDPQVVEPPGLAPPERPHYIRGRNDIVDDLVKALDDAPQDHRVHVLYGLAGIGKTAIVQEVSHRVRERLDRQDVWWLRADSKTMFEGSLRELTERLARRGRDPSAGIVVCYADVRQAWADGQVNRQDLLWGMLHEYRYPWLMIMDGLNDVELLGNHRQRIEGTWWLRKPATGQLVIVTTVDGNLRNFDQSWVQVHHVKSLTPANGALVLRAHAPHATDSNREVEALSRRLCGYPLALTIAGSYLSVTSAPDFPYRDLPRSFRQYRDQLNHRWWDRLNLRAFGVFGEVEPSRLMPQVWQPSLDLIERQGAPWATHLLGLLSSMGTAGTPLAALASGILAQSPIFPDDFSDDQLLQHLTALANFGLIDLVGTHASTIVKLHPLVQETINDSPAARVRLRDYQRTLASLVAHMQAQGERAPNRRAVAWMANCQQLLESEKPGGWLDDASRHWAITSVSRRRLAGWALPAFAALAAVFGFYQPIRRAQGGAPQSSSTDEAAQATGKVVARSSDIQIGSGMIVGDIVIT